MFDDVGDVDVEQELVKYSRTLNTSPRLASVVKQVGGLAVESNGNLVVFHRGSRKWQYE